MNDNFLMHYGQPRRSGRYPWGSGERPYRHEKKSIKAGIRRYQNKDGSLTEAGQRRYERDVRENLAKKKDNRIDTSEPDPKRWVKEDLKRAKEITDESEELVKELRKLDQKNTKTPERIRPDLSNMTDKELRDMIQRELLERQYTEMFGEIDQAEVSKGREVLRTTLDVAGTTLAFTGTALGIALAIKELTENG